MLCLPGSNAKTLYQRPLPRYFKVKFPEHKTSRILKIVHQCFLCPWICHFCIFCIIKLHNMGSLVTGLFLSLHLWPYWLGPDCPSQGQLTDCWRRWIASSHKQADWCPQPPPLANAAHEVNVFHKIDFPKSTRGRIPDN